MIDVITPDGFKKIEDVVVGDMLLTHKRRFRKVSEVDLIDVDDLYIIELKKLQNIVISSKQEIYTYKQQRGDLFNFKTPDELDKEHRVVIPLKGDVYKKIDDKKWSKFYRLGFDLIMDKIKKISKLNTDKIISDNFDDVDKKDKKEQIKYVKDNLDDYPEIKEKVDDLMRLKRNYPKITVEQDNSYCCRGGLVSCYKNKKETKKSNRVSVLND